MRRFAWLPAALGLMGCPFYPRRYYTPPDAPVPLAALNTRWDDYNVTAASGSGGLLIWSTNRGSEGGDFDVWTAHLEEHYASPGYRLGGASAAKLEGVDSPSNEFGPVICEGDGSAASAQGLKQDRDHAGSRWVVFASDRAGGAGGLDLYRAEWVRNTWKTKAPEPLTALNSAANDCYWTYGGEAHPVAYFASDRGGKGFDIYEVRNDAVSLCAPLSSPADDSAPYLVWKSKRLHIVFASRREGGLGGWDLWGSRFGPQGWEAPRNLGKRVNSPSDEFRPSVALDDHRPLLLFSSNRPGGQGGFDLFYARFEAP